MKFPSMKQNIKNKADFKEKEKIFLRPCLVVLSGVPLTGKTVLAEKLAILSNLKIVDVDAVRSEIDETRKNGKATMLEPEKEKDIMVKSYAKMCRQAEEIINQGSPALVAGTFSRSEFKRPLEKLADILRKKNVPLKVFLLTISDKEALKRI